MAHVCRNTFLIIFTGRDTIVFWKMSLLHWLTKLTHQTLYREKTIAEVFCRQWHHGNWTLKTVSEVGFCFILTTGFVRIVIFCHCHFYFLLLLFFLCPCLCHYYCISCFVITITMLHGCCCDHYYYRRQSGYCCYYHCSYYIFLPVLHHCFVLFYGFLNSLSLSSKD